MHPFRNVGFFSSTNGNLNKRTDVHVSPILEYDELDIGKGHNQTISEQVSPCAVEYNSFPRSSSLCGTQVRKSETAQGIKTKHIVV